MSIELFKHNGERVIAHYMAFVFCYEIINVGKREWITEVLEGTVRRLREPGMGWMRADGGRPICLPLGYSIRNLKKFTHLTDMKRLSVMMGLAEDSQSWHSGAREAGLCAQLWV